jgi:osmotically-inducible protein OsmY
VTVRPDPASEPAEYLVAHVRDAIARSDAHELGVRVRVAGGRVLLTGSASSEPQRDAITTVAARAAPGYEVVNELCVAPTTPPAEAEQL